MINKNLPIWRQLIKKNVLSRNIGSSYSGLRPTERNISQKIHSPKLFVFFFITKFYSFNISLHSGKNMKNFIFSEFPLFTLVLYFPLPLPFYSFSFLLFFPLSKIFSLIGCRIKKNEYPLTTRQIQEQKMQGKVNDVIHQSFLVLRHAWRCIIIVYLFKSLKKARQP